MTNVNAVVEQISPIGGATNAGRKLGYLPSTAKAAEGDTITLTNVSEIIDVKLSVLATGVSENATISGANTKVLTLESTTSGSPISGLVYYR